MEERSREENLLYAIYYILRYVDRTPGFFSFGDREILITYPGSITDLQQLIDDSGDIVPRMISEYHVRFAGFREMKDYREFAAWPEKGFLGWNIVLEPRQKNYVVNELSLGLRFEDRSERNSLFSLLKTLDFRNSRLVLERNPYTEEHFRSDVRGSRYIFKTIADACSDNADGIVYDMNHEQLKELFTTYFQTGQDSLELYYIYEYGVYTMALMVGLRESLAENGIYLQRTGNTIEMKKGNSRIRLSGDSESYAERLILNLIFDSDGQEATVDL